MPPEFMEGLLHGIESTVRAYWKEFPKLSDKDVEFVYSKLENYYRIKSSGKSID